MKSKENRFRREKSKEKGIFDYHPKSKVFGIFDDIKVKNIDIDYNRFSQPWLNIDKTLDLKPQQPHNRLLTVIGLSRQFNPRYNYDL